MLAERGHEADAGVALNEAVSLYEGLQARWDIRRAQSRLRPHGIRRGPHGRRAVRVTSGWAALTPTELKVAALVAQGASTSDIAQGMFLSRRTVQTYISRILTKLDAKSRVEIVREALRQDVTPLAALNRWDVGAGARAGDGDRRHRHDTSPAGGPDPAVLPVPPADPVACRSVRTGARRAGRR